MGKSTILNLFILSLRHGSSHRIFLLAIISDDNIPAFSGQMRLSGVSLLLESDDVKSSP